MDSMMDMEIVAAPSSGDLRVCSSSVVIPREPLIDSLEYRAVLHHRAESVMQDVIEESSNTGLHSAMEGHPSSQKSTDIPIKQEPQESDWKYLTSRPPVKGEDEQTPTLRGSPSQTNHGIKLEKTDDTEMSTGVAIPKVESFPCETRNIHTQSPSSIIPNSPVPVYLYRHQSMMGNTIDNKLTPIEHCGIPLFTEKDETHDTGMSNSFVADVRSQVTEKPFKCCHCGYNFARRRALITHMRTHTGEKPFSCSLCEYRSRDNSYLIKHMKTHTGEKPFRCAVCSYRSSYKSSLNRHVRTHTGEKPFKCSLCDYRSARSSLVDHMRTHTGEKAFKCSLCDYGSNRNCHLVAHMRTHTGEKPFGCSLCDYRSFNKEGLHKHMRRHAEVKSD